MASNYQDDNRDYHQKRQTIIASPDVKVKLCVVGDGGIGKTCLMIRYSENRFPTEYVPTIFENYVMNVQFGGKIVEFALWDTAGQEEYDRLRPLSYPESNVIIICFAVDYPSSLENVEEKWFPEVAHFCEGVPIILVATKIDLRRDKRAVDLLRAQGRTPISSEEGSAVARKIGAIYAEASAMDGTGVKEVFELALRESLSGSKGIGKMKKKMKCTIL